MLYIYIEAFPWGGTLPTLSMSFTARTIVMISGVCFCLLATRWQMDLRPVCALIAWKRCHCNGSGHAKRSTPKACDVIIARWRFWKMRWTWPADARPFAIVPAVALICVDPAHTKRCESGGARPRRSTRLKMAPRAEDRLTQDFEFQSKRNPGRFPNFAWL